MQEDGRTPAGTPIPPTDSEERNLAALIGARDRITIGRGPTNDVAFDSRIVSRNHALLEHTGTGFRLRDLGSGNGTFVNGAEISIIELADGDEIWIGDQHLVFDRREAQPALVPRGIRVDLTDVSKEIKGGKKLLQEITLSVLPGELVAVVGGSGAGKSTLLDAMAGIRPASAGSVRYNGRDLYQNLGQYRNVLGYVPQDDIIHTSLPVRRTLEYAAKLRLPSDSSKADIKAAVAQAMAELNLTERADTRVSSLSGGQRKRCSIGVELLTEPRIFFLDEPTSGLDPATETQMMRLLSRLTDHGSTVILTTHATKNLALCDRIVFLASGGYLAYVGPPSAALKYFEADSFDAIYERLAEESSPSAWAQQFLDSKDFARVRANQPQPSAAPGAEAPQTLGTSGRSQGPLRQLRQLGVLSSRNFALHTRGLPEIMPLVMPSLVISLLLLALFHTNIFSLQAGDPTAALILIFLLTFNMFLAGLLAGVQEIVKEFSIFRRERLVNLSIVPYVVSKLTFIVPLLIVEAAFQIALLRLTHRLPDKALSVYVSMTTSLAIVAVAGVSVALLTSALAPTPQAATDLLSLWITPQTLFAGAIFAVPLMNSVGMFFSRIVASRWAFEAIGHAMDLPALFASTAPKVAATGNSLRLQYGDTFARNPRQDWAILAVFIFVPLALTCFVLKRKTGT